MIEKGDKKDEQIGETKEEPSSPTSPTKPPPLKPGQEKLKTLPFEYPDNKLTFKLEELIDAQVPVVKKGKPPKKYEIFPALPPGLKMDIKSGIITGIPSLKSARTEY